MFFFSSRRRHTRSKRDWSSDVCSSDLFGAEQPAFPAQPEEVVGALDQSLLLARRSEERRVGKECRAGWARSCYKKNAMRSSSSRFAVDAGPGSSVIVSSCHLLTRVSDV